MQLSDDIESILFTEEQLAERVAQIGAQVSADYADASEGLVVVTVLRGAVMFAADLTRHIDVPVELDFVRASSYGDGAASSGTVRVLHDASTKLEGRHVLVVEDILDTGRTLSRLMAEFQVRKPASLAAAALVRKDVPRVAKVDCRYVGFDCPDAFIVGYGLDYAQRYRNLPYIGVLKPEIYS